MSNEASRKAFDVWATASVLDTSTWSNSPEVYKSNFTTDAWDAWQASRKALADEQAQAVGPVATSIRRNRTAKEFKFGMDVLNWNRAQTDPPIDAGRELWVSDEVLKLLTNPAPPPAEPTIKQPLSSERAELIARHRVMTKTMTSYGLDTCAALCLESADMLEADGTFIDEGTKAQQVAPYDQQALDLCGECGWKAIMPGEPCFACNMQIDKREPLSDDEIADWFVSENGLEHCSMCAYLDFQAVIRAVEARHGIKAVPQPPQGDKK